MGCMGATMPNYVKKTIELDEDLVKKMRKIFDVKTDKEAVNRALRMVSAEDDIIKAHKKVAGQVDIDEVF